MTQGNAETADAGASGLLRIERADRVLTVGLNRPAKRNALNDGIILEIGECFASLPEDIGAVVIHGIGDHFSSGLDLSELTEHAGRCRMRDGAAEVRASGDRTNLSRNGLVDLVVVELVVQRCEHRERLGRQRNRLAAARQRRRRFGRART